MKNIYKVASTLLFLGVSSFSTNAQVNLPAVNLGDTSFMGGVAGPGFIFQEKLSSYDVKIFKGSNDQSAPGDNDARLNDAFSLYFSKENIWWILWCLNYIANG